MYIDSHCHLSKEYYDSIDEIVNKAKDNNVNKLIISGCDKNGIIEGLDIINKYENIYMTIGFHPSEANITTAEDLIWLENLIKENNKIIAVGEIGLDYYWVKDNKEQQRDLFRKQLSIATRLNLPVVIHSREATQETYDILKEYDLIGIIHCYSGSLEMAKEYIKLGYKIGIGGVVTFKNTNLVEVVKEIDLKNITLETDSPYLAPTPYRGKQNSPEYIPIIAQKIAEIKGITKEEVGKITTNNIKELFNINI
ncbi:MAG: TatD family hydrolase [Bacilli bacterium]|nr:TatD family hydrolase [Bacilli bacterium]